MLILEKEMFSISLSSKILSFGKDFDCGQGSVLSARICVPRICALSKDVDSGEGNVLYLSFSKDFEFWQGF